MTLLGQSHSHTLPFQYPQNLPATDCVPVLLVSALEHHLTSVDIHKSPTENQPQDNAERLGLEVFIEHKNSFLIFAKYEFVEKSILCDSKALWKTFY
jgi:hypothetical protein